jgi:hypothetical protein
MPSAEVGSRSEEVVKGFGEVVRRPDEVVRAFAEVVKPYAEVVRAPDEVVRASAEVGMESAAEIGLAERGERAYSIPTPEDAMDDVKSRRIEEIPFGATPGQAYQPR